MGAGITTLGGVMGLYYSVRSLKERPYEGSHKELAVVMLLPTMLGAIISLAFWFLTAVLHPTITFAISSIPIIYPLEYEGILIKAYLFAPVAWSLLCIIGFFMLRYKSSRTWVRYEMFYGLIVIISVILFAIPIILFRDLYGLFTMLELASTVLTIGSVVLALFLYLRARIEKRKIGELIEGLFIVRRFLWLGLFCGVLMVLLNWNPAVLLFEEFIIGQMLVTIFTIVSVAAFEWVLPMLPSKRVGYKWQVAFTLLLSLLGGMVLATILFSEIEAFPLALRSIPLLALATVSVALFLGTLSEIFIFREKHRLW